MLNNILMPTTSNININMMADSTSNNTLTSDFVPNIDSFTLHCNTGQRTSRRHGHCPVDLARTHLAIIVGFAKFGLVTAFKHNLINLRKQCLQIRKYNVKIHIPIVLLIKKNVRIIRKYHNHKLQTNRWYCEEESHNNRETPGRQTKQSSQFFLANEDACKPRMDTK